MSELTLRAHNRNGTEKENWVKMAMDKRDADKSHDCSTILKEALAEYLGTTVLMVFGIGSVAQMVLSDGQTGSSDQVRWSWGLGVTFGAYVSGGVSGGHLNPAVTLTLCLFKRLAWRKLLPYWIGQYLGSFTGSCLVFGVYYDALRTYQNGSRSIQTASIFATYPQDYLTTTNALCDQILGTGLLMLIILALTDPKNMAPPRGVLPVLVGLAVVALGMTFSHNCGYPLNPARDLSPRLFTLAAGWGLQVFSYQNYSYFWVPVVGPHVGAILGGIIYETCINTSLPCSCRPDRGVPDRRVKKPDVRSTGVRTGEEQFLYHNKLIALGEQTAAMDAADCDRNTHATATISSRQFKRLIPEVF